MNDINGMLDDLKKSMTEKEKEILDNVDVSPSPYARDLINLRRNDIQEFEESYKKVSSTPFPKPDIESFKKRYSEIKRDIESIRN